MESAMTTISQTRTASLLAQMVNAIAGSLVVRARHFTQLVKNRRDATMLAGLDDRMLADIGLTRGDLRDAYSEPVWSDPTAILVSRAHERRVNRRRASVGLAGKVFDSPSIVPAAHGRSLGTPVSARYH
jgi:uncharacterized protein YjiS (DUF1127 family)